MSKQRKTIITCAVTGAIHTPTMSDALPYTYDQIAAQAIEAAEAGASILHLHARDNATGAPSVSFTKYSTWFRMSPVPFWASLRLLRTCPMDQSSVMP